MADKEFKTPQDALAHYGKKGMKWGVRNDDKSKGGGGSSSSGKPKEDPDSMKKATDAFYGSKSKAQLKAEGNAKLKEQSNSEFPSRAAAKQEKRAAKAEDLRGRAAEFDKAARSMEAHADSITPGKNPWKHYEKSVYKNQAEVNDKARDELLKKADLVESGKLTPGQKKLLIAGGLAAVAVAGAYGHQRYAENKAGITPEIKKQLIAENKQKSTDEWKALFGEDPGYSNAFSVGDAEGKGFYAGLTSKKIWDRPEFVIPEGTEFQRLSNHIEDSSDYGKVKGAYATFLTNDKKLYGAGGEFGGKNYTVTFTAKGGTRVPTHSTVLAHLKQIKQAETGNSYSDAQLASAYHSMAGGSWSDKTSQSLFSSLRQFGYGAIVDDMDAGYMGDLPVVFFGQANTATSTPRTDTERLRDSIGLQKVTGKYA